MISDPFELMEYSWSLLTFTSTVGEIDISRTISLYVIALDLCRWVRHNELPLPHEQPHTTSDIFDFRLPKISDLFLHIHSLCLFNAPSRLRVLLCALAHPIRVQPKLRWFKPRKS